MTTGSFNVGASIRFIYYNLHLNAFKLHKQNTQQHLIKSLHRKSSQYYRQKKLTNELKYNTLIWYLHLNSIRTLT